jgi:hypothetical protein
MSQDYFKMLKTTHGNDEAESMYNNILDTSVEHRTPIRKKTTLPRGY